MGLVGLYACRVKRLRNEERNAAHFLGFIGFLGLLQLLYLLIVVCLVVIASLRLFVCFVCVVGGFLSLRMIATKRKGAPCWCSLSLFVGCGRFICRSNSCAVIKKLCCRCFGFFQFVRFVLPTNAARV